MGGHVVGPLGSVAVDGVAVGHQAGGEALEIVEDHGIGVLADDQRGAGVVHEHGAHPLGDAGLGDHPGDAIDGASGWPALAAIASICLVIAVAGTVALAATSGALRRPQPEAGSDAPAVEAARR